MTGMLRKAAISTIAALTMGTGIAATATPSVAGGWHGGGWGGPVAAGILGGLALGALAGSAYAYGPGYYGRCYVQNRPVYDGWGNFVGYRPFQVCY